MNIEIPKGALFIIDRLESLGYRADIVGGCVRDALLGRVANDFDITTSASPEVVLGAFSDQRVIKTGIKHGTVTVLAFGEPYEVTTYRIDGEYADSRHPDSVTFTTRIEDDLERRDFTVNAMAYSPKHGITDLFEGRDDLERRVIRAVGNAEVRFTEDALRIIRAVRFSAVLGFSIEEKTASAARALAPRLDGVSRERIYAEWYKLLSGDGAYSVIREFSDIIRAFLPELSGQMPPRESFLGATAEERQLALFAVSCGDFASERFLSAMQRLKTDRRTRERGIAALENYKTPVTSISDAQRLAFKIGSDSARLAVKLGVMLGFSETRALSILDKAVSGEHPYRISDLRVGGEELSALGLRGKEIGETLSELLECVIDGKAENEKDALLAYLQNHLKK